MEKKREKSTLKLSINRAHISPPPLLLLLLLRGQYAWLEQYSVSKRPSQIPLHVIIFYWVIILSVVDCAKIRADKGSSHSNNLTLNLIICRKTQHNFIIIGYNKTHRDQKEFDNFLFVFNLRFTQSYNWTRFVVVVVVVQKEHIVFRSKHFARI